MASKNREQINLDDVVEFGIAGASAETVQRYGSAIKEHIVAYSGQDNEIGTELTKSLKSISQEKVNPKYQYQNLKQQAGFSAEVKETARANAKNIINGEPVRKIRTDDLGRVNDQLYDHVELDLSGEIIEGSGSQMKFVGKDAQEAFERLKSKKFDKYIENDAKIEVPSDFYNELKSEIEKDIDKLQKQLDKQQMQGNTEQIEKINAQIEHREKLMKNLRKSSVSNDEAMFARQHPGLSTVADMAKLSHQAGVETAKVGVAIGGGMAIVQNMVAFAKGEQDIEESVKNVGKTTLTSAATSYGIGAAGSAVKGAMQNANAPQIVALSETSLPTIIVTTSIQVTRTLNEYLNGEITGTQAVEQMGEKGIGSLAASYGAAIGTFVLPGLGTAVGSMVGYMVSSMLYGSCMQILQEADQAQENYYAIKSMCEEARKSMQKQRMLFEIQSTQLLENRKRVFDKSLLLLMDNLEGSDTDTFTTVLSSIANEFGRELQFKNEQEFDSFMRTPGVSLIF